MTSPAGAVRTPTLAAIVCAYTEDRWLDILRAVESLQNQSEAPREIIVVTDHNAALFHRLQSAFPDVTILVNDSAPGLSGARNTGVRAADSDVVAFLDDDAEADPTWAAHLLSPYSDPQVIGVGGAVVPDWQVPRPTWLPEEFFWVIGCSYTGQPTSRAEVRNTIGANMSFRRDVFHKVGGFDPTVGRIGKDAAGCEETEFSIRALRGFPGSRIILEPAARCRHSVTPDRATRAYFRRRCRAEGRSKAVVSRLSGAGAALESERAYVKRVLPWGVARGLTEMFHGDVSGGTRAYAIIEGLLITTWSYFTAGVTIAHRGTSKRLAK